MNDNYLWDRTGEPDTDVQQLEELLGTLRYQPRPLEIPATMSVKRKRTFIPLSIAAAIALLLIGAGLWIRFANSNQRPIEQAKRQPQSTVAPLEKPSVLPDSATISVPAQTQKTELPKQRQVHQTLVAFRPHRPTLTLAPALTEEELAQKEQVLVALRLVSAKLNFAQRKAQGLPQVNAIRNHKIG
jgi:cytoskeletal protein RodZ